MRILTALFAALLTAAMPDVAMACACCTSPGLRYVETEKLDSFRREEIERVRFAKEAKLYLTEAGVETTEGIAGPADHYGLPFSLPAFVLANEGRYLAGAALLAGTAVILYGALWFQDELGIRKAPWS